MSSNNHIIGAFHTLRQMSIPNRYPGKHYVVVYSGNPNIFYLYAELFDSENDMLNWVSSNVDLKKAAFNNVHIRALSYLRKRYDVQVKNTLKDKINRIQVPTQYLDDEISIFLGIHDQGYVSVDHMFFNDNEIMPYFRSHKNMEGRMIMHISSDFIDYLKKEHEIE